jgi:lipopolysaccharide transport system ATP-binding protein
MMVRLAFSVAVHVNPRVLIVDEVLGVGDSHFQEKCVRKIMQLRAQGATLLCVSHSTQMVLDFCSRAIWLHGGEMMLDGDAKRTLEAYAEHSMASV